MRRPWYATGPIVDSLKSGPSIVCEFGGLAVTTQAHGNSRVMPLAYTKAMVVLREQLSNPALHPTAKRLRRSVPVALRAPEAGEGRRWASWCARRCLGAPRRSE